MRIGSAGRVAAPPTAALDIIDTCARGLVPEQTSLLRWHTGYLADHRARLALDLDIIGRAVPKGRRVVEFGSVPPVLTAALVRCGYEVTGCDIAPERYASAIRSAGLDVVKCNIETERLPFADASFDAAIFNELFEHLRINPIFTLTELLRVLKPGGILTLSTPNLKSLGGITNFMFADRAFSCCAGIYAEYRKLDELGHMGHVREYTPTEVVEFLQTIGFDVMAIMYRGEYAGIFRRTLIRLVPRLSPFVSYMAKKPG